MSEMVKGEYKTKREEMQRLASDNITLLALYIRLCNGCIDKQIHHILLQFAISIRRSTTLIHTHLDVHTKILGLHPKLVRNARVGPTLPQHTHKRLAANPSGDIQRSIPTLVF